MKPSAKIILTIAFLVSVVQGYGQHTDRDLVYAAVEDYVDGLYLAQPDRIKKSVHPELTKKGYWFEPSCKAFMVDPFFNCRKNRVPDIDIAHNDLLRFTSCVSYGEDRRDKIRKCLK